MTIRIMNVDEVRLVLSWAEAEGWNPGLDDAAAFYAADPHGFLLKEVNGEPAAAVSVVNHNADFAFLGLYLCKPEYRGQGHGMDVWQAGIAHAEGRCIGLDGVPDQQDNYARSGFSKVGSTVRFEGRIDAKPDPRTRTATPTNLPVLLEKDLEASGVQRPSFVTAWFSETENRKTIVLAEGTNITGFATFRRCKLGSKIGPLHAPTDGDALALLRSNPFLNSTDPVFVDTQGHNSALAGLVKSQGFTPVFETARMFTGEVPQTRVPKYHAIATMELG